MGVHSQSRSSRILREEWLVASNWLVVRRLGLEILVNRPDPPVSPLGIGLQWASRISAIGFEFVVPAVVGAWVDRQLGITPWLTILGCFVGIAVGMYQIMQIAREGPRSGQR